MRRTRVYISANLVPAISATEALLTRGYVIICPVARPEPDDTDVSLLHVCDAVLRIGPENETVRRAPSRSIPVYWSLDSLCASEPVER